MNLGIISEMGYNLQALERPDEREKLPRGIATCNPVADARGLVASIPRPRARPALEFRIVPLSEVRRPVRRRMVAFGRRVSDSEPSGDPDYRFETEVPANRSLNF